MFTNLAGVHGNDTRKLEVFLGDTHALGFAGKLALAQLAALLILNGAEHPERPVLPCTPFIAVLGTTI